MLQQTDLAGSFTLSGTSMTVNRMGYGAMQLAVPGVWGPPGNVDAAIAVLREAIESGVNHIDTSDYYSRHVTNRTIKQALHPYPDHLVIVTKVGARRGADKSWIPALPRQELIDGIHDNLRNLGLDALAVVNLRVGGIMQPSEGSIEEPLTVLAELERQGVIGHIGLSNITPKPLTEAQTITEIVCVQNSCNLAQRKDDSFIATSLPEASLTFRSSRCGIHPSTVVAARHSGSVTRSNVHAAAATLAQHPADSRNVFSPAPARESAGFTAAGSR